MTTLEEFKLISKLTGVDQYILVDHMGKIAVHDIKDPERLSGIVFSCGKNSYAIGKTGFKYVLFSRKNQKNIFIFPVGNYYLGVIKLKNINNDVLADNIINFLQSLRRG